MIMPMKSVYPLTKILTLAIALWFTVMNATGQTPDMCDPPVISCPEAITVTSSPGECGSIVNYPMPVVEASCPCLAPEYIPGDTFAGVHNNHKYFLSDYETSWTSAHLMALSVGGNLASVQDNAENLFLAGIANTVGNSIWIGFTDQDVEGTFVWTDGSPVTFTNWSPGEPNNLGDEDYTELYSNGIWNDIPANAWLKRAVIEFPCAGLARTGGLPSGNFFPTGTTEVSYLYVDALGNTTSCSFPVTVTDTEPPVIDCPADITVAGIPYECGTIVNLEPPIATDNCYTNGSLSTTFAGGNGYYGSMFDIVALNPIKIKNFTGHVKYGTHQIDIYYKTGSHVGFEHNPGAWTLLGSVNVTGNEAPTLIPFDVNISVSESQTVAFFIAGTGAFNYSNGSAVGAVAAQNDDLQILIGKSRMEWGEGGSIFQPRIWNGTVNYEVNTLTISQISGPASGSLFPTGSHTIVWQATDNSGNTSTCTQSVWVSYDSVNFTVGSGGDFPNLTGEGGLFQYLNGHAGLPVVKAEIISDLTEPGTYPLTTFTPIWPCAANLVEIFVQGTTVRTVSGNVAQAMIRLEGSDRVTFRGGSGDLETGGPRFLCFRNTNPGYPTIALSQSASSTRFLSCIIEGSNTNANSGVFVIGGTPNPVGNSFHFLFNNLFSGISTANSLPANLFYSSGTAGAPNTDNTLFGNEFRSFETKGIALTSTGNGSRWHLVNNSLYLSGSPVANANKTFVDFQPGAGSDDNLITGTAIGGNAAFASGLMTISGVGTLRGILVHADGCNIGNTSIKNISLTNTAACNFTGIEVVSGAVALSQTEFSGISVAGTGTLYGILTSGSSACDISRSNIHDVVFTKTSGSPVFKGIQLKKGSVSQSRIYGITATQAGLLPTIYGIANVASNLSSPNQIFNNMVSITAGASSKARVYGLFDQSIGLGADFYHNTVSLSGITTNAYFTAAFYRIGNGAVNVYNNILVNTRISTSLAKHYAIATNSPYYWMSNYNCLFTTSASLGLWNSSNFNTFATWKMMTSQDANSVNLAPAFVSATDLHLSPANSMLDNKGGMLFSYGTDYDNEVRSGSTPDIGADEFSGIPLSLEPQSPEPVVSTTASGNSLSVYPNPFSVSNTLDIRLNAEEDIRLEIYSMMGSLIWVIAEGHYAEGLHSFTFDARNLPAGTYLCRFVINGKESMVKRIELVK